MRNSAYVCERNLFVSYLSTQICTYIEYKVNVGGCVPESFIPVLRRFDRYCGNHPQDHICLKVDTVLGFLGNQATKNSTACREASVLRSFGRYLTAVLGISDVFIVQRLIKRKGKTFVPYVFSHKEISSILDATQRYQPKCSNKSTANLHNCMQCIMVMLYCTGMRVSEISFLAHADVDMEQGIIHINHAKNDNHRIVTMSSSLKGACQRYLAKAEGVRLSGVYFFDSGSPLHSGRVARNCIYSYFRRYLSLAGIEHHGLGWGPRLHDIRVTFATHSLQRLTEENADVNACLYYLATYMGHQSIYETQEYLWLTSEAFRSILGKMDDYTSFITTVFDKKVGDMDDE